MSIINKLFKTPKECVPPTPVVIPVVPVKVYRTWRRVALSVFGVTIIVFIWRWSTMHLYTLPEHSIAAFSSLTSSAFYVIGVIVVFLVTGLTFFSWTQSSSIATSVGNAVANAIKDPENTNPQTAAEHHHPDLEA